MGDTKQQDPGDLFDLTVVSVNGTAIPAAPTAGHVLTAVTSTSAAWTDPALVIGPTGPTGPQGPTGAAGADGYVTVLGRDLTGSKTSQTVIGLRGIPIAVESLGADQDGYVLTYSFADGYFAFRPKV